jgi:hypothetical protein
MSEFFDNKTDKELLESLLAETAKASNEMRCAQRDINKAAGRLQFAVMALNTMINRDEDQ